MASLPPPRYTRPASDRKLGTFIASYLGQVKYKTNSGENTVERGKGRRWRAAHIFYCRARQFISHDRAGIP